MSKLAENIRNYRKELGFTQEELAERLGITLGTISKWERGSSEPDIDYIMDLAEIFRVSVDVLIGFSMRGNDPDIEIDRIEGLVKERKIVEATEEYEKALLKFPNNFKIVFHAASAYERVGLFNDNKEVLDRAIELYKHSIELISQNNDESINEIVIKNQIADCYSHKDDYDRALKEYKKNNINGMNNFMIGSLYVHHTKEQKEGFKYLMDAFFDQTAKNITVLAAFINYYNNKGEIDKCLWTSQFAIDYLNSLKLDKNKRSYLDKIISVHYMILGMAYEALNDLPKAKEYMKTAFDIAADFDEHPCHSTENMVFSDDIETSNIYDDVGASAMEGLERIVLDKTQVSESFKNLFYEELNNYEKANKKSKKRNMGGN